MSPGNLQHLDAIFTDWSGHVSSHVKWFSDYDLQCSPRSPLQIVFGEYFLLFCLFTGSILFAVTYVDRYLSSKVTWLNRTANALTLCTQDHYSIILRVGVCAFFITASAYGGFILTPELETQEPWVAGSQLAIAGLVLIPSTAFLAGFGIAFLYGFSVSGFGLYHLLDYPIFMGVGAYLVIDSLYGRRHSVAAQTIVRVCTGVTLLWAAIEKFAYPEWSFILLNTRPNLKLGFSNEFYMMAAGFVEFCAAYLLITGILSARAAAVLLLFFFVSAIYYFGVIDAIGHSVIIVVLALLILSHNPLATHFEAPVLLHTAVLHAALFLATLLLFIALYSGGHSLTYESELASRACTS